MKSYSSSKSSALLQRPHCELPSAFCLLELSLGFLHSTDTWCIFHFYFCWVIVEKSNLITTGFQKLVCLHPWIPLLCFSYSSQTKQWVWLCCLAQYSQVKFLILCISVNQLWPEAGCEGKGIWKVWPQPCPTVRNTECRLFLPCDSHLPFSLVSFKKLPVFGKRPLTSEENLLLQFPPKEIQFLPVFLILTLMLTDKCRSHAHQWNFSDGEHYRKL